MNQAQFIARIAHHIRGACAMPARQALQVARQAYQALLIDSDIAFGDPAFAWDAAAARSVAVEYEIAYW